MNVDGGRKQRTVKMNKFGTYSRKKDLVTKLIWGVRDG